MGAKLRSWWKKERIPQAVMGLIVALIALIALIFVEVRLYGTGFAGKTLWDWLQLAIIPSVLTFGVWWLTRLQQRRDQQLAERQAQTEREISLDNQHEMALQGYIDNMSALQLEKDLREPIELEKVRKIARVRTLTVLPRCDGRRKALVLNFLYESGLIDKDQKIVDLSGADLSEAELIRAQLSKADLSRANLSRANLFEANLIEANLSGTVFIQANLSGAKLMEADLRGADLSEAILDGAIVTSKQLEEAKSIRGVIIHDESKYL
jgi:uncharacterized protein YjbI with pentapeptide repeats